MPLFAQPKSGMPLGLKLSNILPPNSPVSNVSEIYLKLATSRCIKTSPVNPVGETKLLEYKGNVIN
jgi:hypothetical protein